MRGPVIGLVLSSPPEEDLGTELHSPEFSINEPAVNLNILHLNFKESAFIRPAFVYYAYLFDMLILSMRYKF